MSSIVAGEYAENEIRKDFTTMERTAIGRAREAIVAKEAKERQETGMAPDLGGDCPQGERGPRTRDIVAKDVGFKNGTEYERAKKVSDKGSAALMQAVDDGTIAISPKLNAPRPR